MYKPEIYHPELREAAIGILQLHPAARSQQMPGFEAKRKERGYDGLKDNLTHGPLVVRHKQSGLIRATIDPQRNVPDVKGVQDEPQYILGRVTARFGYRRNKFDTERFYIRLLQYQSELDLAGDTVRQLTDANLETIGIGVETETFEGTKSRRLFGFRLGMIAHELGMPMTPTLQAVHRYPHDPAPHDH